jgi:hypothetical protein
MVTGLTTTLNSYSDLSVKTGIDREFIDVVEIGYYRQDPAGLSGVDVDLLPVVPASLKSTQKEMV